MEPTAADAALLRLLQRLEQSDYDFVTVTPSTHERIVRRPRMARATDLRGVLGWSLPFDPADIDPPTIVLLDEAQALDRQEDGLARSRVRASRVAGRFYLHSAFPTGDKDAVFLGPDSYRFAALLQRELSGEREGLRVVDIGTGAGVGGLTAADLCPRADLTLTDINPAALRLARINAAHAGRDPRLAETSGLDGLDGPFDVVVANPPYILGSGERTYRDGGDLHGARLSLDWSVAAMARLSEGGRLILYTGSAIVDGVDGFRGRLEAAAADAGCDLRYREIDPDVFGGTLPRKGYEEVERIAVVAAVATKRET